MSNSFPPTRVLSGEINCLWRAADAMKVTTERWWCEKFRLWSCVDDAVESGDNVLQWKETGKVHFATWNRLSPVNGCFRCQLLSQTIVLARGVFPAYQDGCWRLSRRQIFSLSRRTRKFNFPFSLQDSQLTRRFAPSRTEIFHAIRKINFPTLQVLIEFFLKTAFASKLVRFIGPKCSEKRWER